MHIANISGSGSLIFGGKDPVPADYDIDIYLDRNMKTAEGTIDAEYGVLFNAFNAGGTKLRLSNGAEINVLITNVTYGQDCKIVVSGPIPGY